MKDLAQRLFAATFSYTTGKPGVNSVLTKVRSDDTELHEFWYQLAEIALRPDRVTHLARLREHNES